MQSNTTLQKILTAFKELVLEWLRHIQSTDIPPHRGWRIGRLIYRLIIWFHNMSSVCWASAIERKDEKKNKRVPVFFHMFINILLNTDHRVNEWNFHRWCFSFFLKFHMNLVMYWYHWRCKTLSNSHTRKYKKFYIRTEASEWTAHMLLLPKEKIRRN